MLCSIIRFVQLQREKALQFSFTSDIVACCFPGRPCCPHLTVHEPLELQFSNSKLTVLFGQAPAGLGKVDLSSPHDAHVFGWLTQFQLVSPLQLKVLKAPEGEGICY